MAKKRITITIDEPVAEYLSSFPNTSSVVCEAVKEYRARRLEIELEAAYREDADESAEINADWEPADAGAEE